MTDPTPELEPEESLVSHLVELRARLIRAAVAVLVVLCALLPWYRELYSFVAQPLLASLPQGERMITTDMVGVVLVPLKVTMILAFLIALPYVLYQVWAFVAPGLYSHEKRLALPLLAMSVCLFFIGMAFAYFLVFPMVFAFMSKIAPEGVARMPDIDKYVTFVMTTFLAFGAAFEIPVVVILLVRAGIVDIEKLKAARPYVIVGAFILGAVLTPPDVFSQFMLAIPMSLLYELGIFMAKYMLRATTGKRQRHDEKSAATGRLDD
ncbi:MAG: twin-arginine translocase subunit TatC [Zoogloeaceae bacterium]|jgi:sec-independent protein translocase protein TatC|nr:twin-arginine translocase subunit TatC [Zoogloeaceae bacterium]